MLLKPQKLVGHIMMQLEETVKSLRTFGLQEYGNKTNSLLLFYLQKCNEFLLFLK